MIDKKRLICLAQKLLSINSENPPGREGEIAEFISKEMKEAGLSVISRSFAKSRPNIIALLKGKGDRRRATNNALLLTPHVDTVPIGNGWKYDPFGKDIKNGRLYGRGASDDKGNVAVCLEVMRSLKEDGVKLNSDIVMAATADEECGSAYGILPLLREKVLKPKLALVLDSDEGDCVIAQKGLIHLRIKLFGKKAHGAYNWKGINAIEKAANIISRIKQISFSFNEHPLLRPPTVNIGTIKGGDKVNMVADYCEFSVDIRFLPGMADKIILKEINNILIQEGIGYKVCVDDLQQPYEISKDNVFVRKYIESAKKFGCRAILKGSEGATVITFFKKYNIPAFASGFGASGTAHTTDEYVFVESLYKGARIIEHYIKEYDKI
ncbi:MAG: M20 family metallopeptidase [Candidatus Omnitrophica bacterium]|nr:M20 family metallopeptidase [Candidatus Omnitrophota bacterium]